MFNFDYIYLLLLVDNFDHVQLVDKSCFEFDDVVTFITR
jgi:hypothetical protein